MSDSVSTFRAGKGFDLYQGDVLTRLAEIPDHTFDALLTDPPYGLSVITEKDIRAALQSWLAGEVYQHNRKGFMNQEWDAFVPGPEVWREVYRVLKPGAFGFVASGSKTHDLMGISLRLAGFEIRDQMVYWVYSNGFPKNYRLSEYFDKEAGVRGRELGRTSPTSGNQRGEGFRHGKQGQEEEEAGVPVYEPVSPEAKEWFDYGSGLKPAHEPFMLIRKPPTSGFLQTARTYACGALNIGGGRKKREVGDRTEYGCEQATGSSTVNVYGERQRVPYIPSLDGRWPANVMFDEHAARVLDRQSGISRSRTDLGVKGNEASGNNYKGAFQTNRGVRGHSDEGGASRYFHVLNYGEIDHPLEGSEHDRFILSAKVKNSERHAGLPRGQQNDHPTLKPVEVTRYLATLLLPPAARDRTRKLLVPYSGSGSEMIGAKLAGFELVVGIEGQQRYVDIAYERISYWVSGGRPKQGKAVDESQSGVQPLLFE